MVHKPCVLQACLSWWSVVSPFSGFGSTAALAFVLIVAAIKATFEDKKRHQEDHRTNKSTAHVVQADGEPVRLHHHASSNCSSQCHCHDQVCRLTGSAITLASANKATCIGTDIHKQHLWGCKQSLHQSGSCFGQRSAGLQFCRHISMLIRKMDRLPSCAA